MKNPFKNRVTGPGPTEPSCELVVNVSAATTGGSLSYALRFLSALNQTGLGQRSVIVTSKANTSALSEVWDHQTMELPFSHPALRVIYEQLFLGAQFRSSSIVGLFNFAPVAIGRKRSTVVIHNPNYFGRGHKYNQNPSVRFRIERALCHLTVARAAATVAISESIREEILADRPGTVIEVAQSGRPTLSTPRCPEAMTLPEGSFFLSLANGYKHKQLDDLARGWAWSRTKADLVFVGQISAGHQETLAAICQESKDGRCFFIGAVSDPDVVAWFLQNCLALVSASALEAHPLTPAEAASFGKPLLLSDIPPHREVGGLSAHYYEPSSPEQLGKLLQDVFDGTITSEAWTWPVSWDDTQRKIASTATRVS